MNFLDKIKNKNHIIWDWNGTILNDVDHVVAVMNRILLKEGLPFINRDNYKDLFEFPVKKYYDKLGFDYSKRSFEDLCLEFVDLFMKGVGDCLPFPEIEEVLKKVKEEGKMQSVLSATDQENLNWMMKHFNYSKHFDYVFGIDNKLADSKIYRGVELMKVSNVPKDETVLIGDTLHDLEAGREMGVEVILITHGHQSKKRLLEKYNNVCTVI